MNEGGAGSAAALRASGASIRITNQQNIEPFLVNPPHLKDYDFKNPPSPSFLHCEQNALSLCFRRFGTSRRSLSECLYGHMLVSQLLPPQILALADDARLDTSGAFAVGASVVCPLPVMGGEGIPSMVEYF